MCLITWANVLKNVWELALPHHGTLTGHMMKSGRDSLNRSRDLLMQFIRAWRKLCRVSLINLLHKRWQCCSVCPSVGVWPLTVHLHWFDEGHVFYELYSYVFLVKFNDEASSLLCVQHISETANYFQIYFLWWCFYHLSWCELWRLLPVVFGFWPGVIQISVPVYRCCLLILGTLWICELN